MAEISDDAMRLAEDLASAPFRLEGAVDKVVEKGALNIKTDWRAAASGMQHLPQYPYSIGYDRVYAPGLVGAEIGPDKNKRQGPLGNIDEFGTSKQPGHLRGAAALAAEEPRFVSALEDAIEAATLP
jgi:hypothetical protein